MRIAFFSPLNPMPSGISDYSEALLPPLAARAERVDVFIEDYEPTRFAAPGNVRIRPWRDFEPDYQAGNYDVVLYQMGNNPFHVYAYDLALRIPGVLVLHEFNLHYLLADATISRGDWDGYFREIEYNAGAAALERARRAKTGMQEPDYDNVAMNRRLLERSRGAIVHSDYMVRLIEQSGFSLPVRKIPHGVEIPSLDVAAARKQLDALAHVPLTENTPVVGIFGFLKPYKRIHEALRAFARLRAVHPEVKMVLAGEEHPRYPLCPLIAELGLEDAVRILGYVPLETFTACMAACDLCLNLRRPTAGETSGSFLRALALGKPALVSEIGAFVELPEEVAVKVPVDGREEDWLFEYMNVLLEDRPLAQAIGVCGRDYVAAQCAWPNVAGQYVEFLAQCAATEPAALQPESSATGVPCGRATLTRVSREELEEYILGFSHSSEVAEEYALLHLGRLVRTLQVTPLGADGDRILEMGCYLQITPALRKYLGYGEVRGAYYGLAGTTDLRTTTSLDGEVFACTLDLFDAERDPYPYPDNHFRTVLCCELLEHLAADPMHMMAEINRILAPGGWLLLSTPSIVSLRSIRAVLHGYHPGLFHAYVKPNADGTTDPRHSREYTPREIAGMMQQAGFQVDLLETGGYGKPGPEDAWTEQFLRANHVSLELRGEVIYCRARKTGPVRDRWPMELYYPPA